MLYWKSIKLYSPIFVLMDANNKNEKVVVGNFEKIYTICGMEHEMKLIFTLISAVANGTRNDTLIL
jgi:hypothetical protein